MSDRLRAGRAAGVVALLLNDDCGSEAGVSASLLLPLREGKSRRRLASALSGSGGGRIVEDVPLEQRGGEVIRLVEVDG